MTSKAKDRLQAGQLLQKGEFLTSPNDKYRLNNQQDGNIVLVEAQGGRVIWAAGTGSWTNPANRLVLRDDGHLAIAESSYDNWSVERAVRDTNRATEYRRSIERVRQQGKASKVLLTLQNDGNLVLSCEEVTLWDTDTPHNQDEKLPQPKAPSSPDRLRVGESLRRKQELVSPNGQTKLIFQEDGNLVLYGPGQKVMWSSDSYKDNNATVVVLQEDGYLVMRSDNGQARWSIHWSKQKTDASAELVVDDRVNYYIRSNGLIVWCTDSGLIQRPPTKFDPISPNSDRVRAPQFLPVDTPLKSANGRFTATLSSGGLWTIKFTETNSVVCSKQADTGNKVVARVAVDYGCRLQFLAADNTTIWQPDRGRSDDENDTDLVIQNDGRLVFQSSGFWKDIIFSSPASFPLAEKSADSLYPGDCLIRGQYLTSGDYSLGLSPAGSLIIRSKNDTRYIYVMGKERSVDNASFLRVTGERALVEILDPSQNVLWTSDNRKLRYDEYDRRSGPTRLLLNSNGTAQANQEGNWVWSSGNSESGVTEKWVKPPTLGSSLSSGKSLTPNTRLESDNGQYYLEYQTDGNLVLNNRHVVWSTDTGGTSPGKVLMLDHGDLQVVDAQGNIKWHSDTANRGSGAIFRVQDDLNLVIYVNGGTAIWSSGTYIYR